jgi:hypothetical protein
MKNKLIGIFVCMLVTTTVVSATNLNVKKGIQTVASAVDVPVWEIGDSWTYNEQYNQIWYDTNGDIYFHWFHNCTSTYTVTADTGNTYTVKVTSKNDEGSLKYGLFRLKFTPSVKFTQEIQLRKTDLGYVHMIYQEKGLVFWLLGKMGLPIPAQYSDVWEVTLTPGYVYLPFPFTAGTDGIIPGDSETGHEKMGLYWGLIKFMDSDFSYDFTALNYTCEMANIVVPSGTYDTYNVSTDVYSGSSHNYTRFYYAPEVGFFVKKIEHSDVGASGMLTYDERYELVSTTYKP